MTNNSIARWRADIGGRWLADLGAFGLLIPAWFVLSILSSPNFLNWPTIAYLIIANAAALGLCWVLLMIFRATIFRHRFTSPIRLATVLCAGAVMGALKSVATSAAFYALAGEDTLGGTFESRLISGTFIGLWLLPLGAVVLATRERYREERQILIAERVQQRSTSLGAPNSTREPELSSETRSQLRDFVAKTRAALDEGAHDSAALAKQIHDIIREQLRPLSHRIWREEDSRYTDFSLPDLLRLTIINRNFATLWILGIYALEAFPLVVSTVGLGAGVARITLEVVLMAIALEVGRRLPVGNQLSTAAVFFGSIVVGVIFSDIAASTFFGPFGDFNFIALDAINIVTITFTALIIGAVRTAFQSHELIRRSLLETMSEEDLAGAYENSQRRIHNREFAQFLHGRVQARMLETALRLENVGSHTEVTRIRDELDLIEDAVNHGMPTAFPGPLESLPASLHKIMQSWNGLVDVELSPLPNELDLHSRLVQQLVEVVHEAIGNAVRHGFATEILITVSKENSSSVQVTVRDNGTGPRLGKRGLGSDLYDSIAPGSWQLSSSQNRAGSIFTLSLRTGL